MKVLMINSVCGFGSTGSICVDIATVLELQGHECYIAYGQGTTTYKKSYKIGTVLENHIHNLGSRLLGKQGYFTKKGTQQLVQFIKQYNPDIIHLHNLHGNYLNLKVLFEYLINVQKPVVWTLHDCWAFTGKCAHYTDIQCFKWQTHCANCPQLQTYPPSVFIDQSQTMFADKKKWFTSLNQLTITPVSHWLTGQVQQSFLQNIPTQTIYNWIDASIFKPMPKELCSSKYKLDPSKFTIIVVSAGWHVTDVKWQDLIKLSQAIGTQDQIVMVGKVENKSLVPHNCINIDYVHNKEELASLYSFADVYIHLSTEDTFGKVIAEAMSCGTPAIVYNATACPEIVGNDGGFVVEKRNIHQIVDAINNIKQQTKDSFSANCRKRVVQHFDLTTNINQIINLYQNKSNS